MDETEIHDPNDEGAALPPDEPDVNVVPEDKDDGPLPKRPRGRPRKDTIGDIEDVNELRQLVRSKETEIKAIKHGSKKQIKELQEQIASVGEGRLREKQRFTGEINQLKADLDSKSDEVMTLLEENDEKDKTINNLQARLDQKSREYDDLLEHLDSYDSSIASDTNKLSGVILVDDVTSSIVPHLSQRIKLTKVVSTLAQIPDIDFRLYDCVIILSGTRDLIDGQSPTKILSQINSIADRAKEAGATPILVQPPPIDTKSITGKMSLLIHKMSKLGLTFAKVDTSNTSKYDFLQKDGFLLSEDGAKRLGNLINRSLDEIDINSNQTQSCSSRSKEPQPTKSMEPVVLFRKIQEDDIGKVIGKGGHTIKKLSQDFNVNISIGKWYEKNKSERGSGKYEEVCDAVIVSGTMTNACESVEVVGQICDNK